MTAPVARITGSRSERARAWLIRLFEPPRLLRNLYSTDAMWWWSLTAAMAAGFAVGATMLIAMDRLMNVNMALSLAWVVFILLGLPIFILPFLVSYSLVRHVRFRSRYTGAAYGAVFHVTAHCAVLYGLQLNPLAFPVILAPLLVGALWGSWLPAALTDPP